jgi:PAS domain S-box-containing protein
MIVGIDAMIADVSSMMMMIESISRRCLSEGRVQMQYYAGPEDAISSGDMLSCRWMLRTENAMSFGALCECHCQGMLRVRFSPSHKISYLELIFDVMGFMQQLQRASGLDEFRVVPNTLIMAQQPTEDARFITTADSPCIIVHVSPAWTRVCGYLAEEALGRPLSILQGPRTDRTVILRFMESIRRKHCCTMEAIKYTKAGVPFTCLVTAYPLTTDGRVTHFLATVNMELALKSLPQPSLPTSEVFPSSCILPQAISHSSILSSNAPLNVPLCSPSSSSMVRQGSVKSMPTVKVPNTLQRLW